VSRLTARAIGEALSFGKQVYAVTVVIDDAGADDRIAALEADWRRWDPGVPLRVLRTEYASVVAPIVAFIDELCTHSQPVVVLIPVVVPGRLRYLILHNQVDVVLSAALRGRSDVVVAKVPMALTETPDESPDPASSGVD
jgi:hypothetical protein